MQYFQKKLYHRNTNSEMTSIAIDLYQKQYLIKCTLLYKLTDRVHSVAFFI